MNYNVHQDFSMCVDLSSLRGFVKKWNFRWSVCVRHSSEYAF